MTAIPFLPNNNETPPFQTTVTLDGQSYSLATMWSIYRMDWMISLTDQNGNLVVNMPLIGSLPDFDIPLAPGFFTTNTLVYRAASEQFEILP